MHKLFFVLTILFFTACNTGPFDINKQGGTVYTLESDVIDFLVTEVRHTNSPAFLRALRATQTAQAPNNQRFLEVFLGKYEELNPGAKLVEVFVVAQPKQYTLNMTNVQLKNKLVERYGLSMNQTLQVLSTRLDNFGVPEGDRKLYKNREGLMVLQIADGYDKQRMRGLIQTSAHLGFFETWENEETYRYLVKLDEELGTDSILTATLKDSVEKQHPLFSHLKPAIYRGDLNHQQLEPGCRIGTTLVRDTAFVNRLLKHNITMGLLPRDMHLLWAANPEREGNMEGYLHLYAVKTESMYYPALDGEVITDAHTENDRYNDSRIIVAVTMNDEGAKKWERLTDVNTGKAIAIVLDGYVYSAPRVDSKIPNGQSWIQGNFSIDEAKDLSLVLRSGSLPVRTRIVDERSVPANK